MAKILFRVFPESGHMNASFGLARELSARGHSIVYASVSVYENSIESQGFEFHCLAQEIGWSSSSRFTARAIRSPLAWLRMQKGKFAWLRARRKELLNSTAFHTEITTIRPDLVFVDSTFVRHSLNILKWGVPFAIIESQVSSDYESNVPPPISHYVPKGTHLSRLRCKLEWLIYFSKRRILQLFGWHPMESKSFMKKICKSTGFTIKDINFNRCFRIGLTTIPEILISPPELDFPRSLKENQLYGRASVDSQRTEISYDYGFDRVFEEVITRKNEDASHKLVYCSLGGMSFRYIGIEVFFRRLIQACSRMENLSLLISMGNELNIESFEPSPKNVSIFIRVPQLRVLEATDLMVMHGGTNSISECITAGVPILAYPGSVDQPGNAARLVYHGMGLMGTMAKESSKQMQRKIESILSNESYTKNVHIKRDEILRNTTPDKIDASIDAILKLEVKMREAIRA